MTHAALKVHNLTVNYEKTPVLWDISLEIPQGKLVAVVGPNGAGKSTFLKASLGLVKPISGHITFLGMPFKAARKKIAYVPQKESVDWDFPMNVFDLVRMGSYGHLGFCRWPGKKENELTYHYLDQVGMKPYADRQIGQLSGGQQQRAFIARALLQQADLYLMDEPFAGIDVTSSQVILDILKLLRDEGKTVFVVHHDLEVVKQCFDWVILLNTCLVGCGEVKEIFTTEMINCAFGGGKHVIDRVAQLTQKKAGGYPE